MRSNRELGESLDERLGRFGRRLDSILGRVVPRREKRARAHSAMEAVEDLVAAIEDDVGQFDRPER